MTVENLNAFKPHISHICYHVADIDRALKFYLGVLGMKETMRLPLGKTLSEVVLAFPESKGGGVILMWDTTRTAPIEHKFGYSRFVVSVSDVDAALQHVTSHGAPVLTPATDAGNMRYALIGDPDGYVIELLHIKR
jgi:catechol 2,3-dioxygenase-like lactoylglutathione lyase family enzyme